MSATLFPLPTPTTPPEWMAIEALRRDVDAAQERAEALDTWAEGEGWHVVTEAELGWLDQLYRDAQELTTLLATRENIVKTWLKGWWTNGGL